MSDVKIYGPYGHRGGWRCYIQTELKARAWCRTGTTPQAARELAEDAVAEFRATEAQTIRELLDGYLGYLEAQGSTTETVIAARDKLLMLLGPLLSQSVSALTPRRAESRYLELAPTCAATTHRKALNRARGAWKWAVRRGLAKSNPWVEVDAIGRPNKGRPQLTDDETKRLIATCLDDAMTSDAALAILVCIFTGVRKSEVTKRVVRDVDGGGTRLIITRAKTPRGNRAPKLPQVIQAAILARCEGRAVEAPLLQNGAGNHPQTGWLNRALRDYCERAGVPSIVPHALRGGFATFAYDSDVAADAVAAHLGHASSSMTEQHYAEPDAVAGAKQDRRLAVLIGGKR